MTTGSVRAALPIAAIIAVFALSGCSSPGSSSVSGDWGKEAAGEPSLTIESDGTFSGTDGCNPVEGTGTISGDTFTFGPFAAITKACDGVTPWLNLAHTAKAHGDTLTVYRSGGEEIGTLDRR